MPDDAPAALTLAVLNPKGGSGKTTVAVHLARAFQAMTPGAVVILDTDPQGTATDWRGDAPDGYDGPRVVPIASARELRSGAGGAASADVAVIDGSAKLEGMTGAVVAVADAVVIPVQPSALDVRPALDVAGLCERAGTPAAFVVSAAVTGSRLARQVRAALDASGFPVMDAQTAHRVAYAEAMARGVTVLDDVPGLRPDSRARAEVRAVAREVASFLDTHT
jgi:chromosome partitioning protein